MLDMELDRVIEITGGEVCRGDIGKYGKRHIKSICYDSRKAGGGSIFVPIAGEKVDAHRFISQVFATECFVSFTEHDNIEYAPGCEKILVRVADSVEAAQKLAAIYRSSIRVPVVGITGSVGKTTTREMISLALSADRKVYATRGNRNSQIGTPETILSFDDDADICVFEMGMSMPGEMTRLAAMVRPDVAVFTNIGVTHIENLGSREAIMEEKQHIMDYMKPGTPVIINSDNDMLGKLRIRQGLSSCRYGLEPSCDVYAENIDLSEGNPRFTAVVNGKRVPVRLGTYGSFQIYNALAGLAVADHFGADLVKSAEKLGTYTGYSHRSQILKNGHITVIDDTYNAAPDSMRAALDMLSTISCEGRRIAVLADMKELGNIAADAHFSIGEYARGKGNIDMLISYGELAKGYDDGFSSGSANHAGNGSELEDILRSCIRTGDTVLFKGSNSMGLFNFVDKVLAYEYL